MLLYKYRPWNDFGEKVLTSNSIFYPSKKNLNDLAELIHPIKFDTNTHEIFREKSNQKNSTAHKMALVTASYISDIFNRIDNGLDNEVTINKYPKYLTFNDKYQRIVEATYDEIENIHDAFFYYAVNQFENAKLLYCSYEEAINRMNSKLNQIGILSLSSKCDCPVMWAHYAANHTGVIFIFDTSKDDLLNISKQVEYLELRQEMTLQSIPENFYKKAKAWNYEQEYRVLVKNGDNCHQFNQEALVGIIIGIRMDGKSREHILSIVRDFNLNVTVYQAESSLESFKIAFKEIPSS